MNTGYQFGGLSRSSSILPPMSPFSAYNLLRNCNYFLEPPSHGTYYFLKHYLECPVLYFGRSIEYENKLIMSSINNYEIWLQIAGNYHILSVGKSTI